MFDLRNNHRVFVLGAGFSAARGLPLMSNFSMRMRDAAKWCESNGRGAEADAIAEVLQFRLDAASAAYRVNLDLENIEELFSLASASNPDIAKSVRVSIAATLNFCEKTTPNRIINASPQQTGAVNFVQFGLMPPGHGETKQLDFYAGLVANLLGGDDATMRSVISFNYDMQVERALELLKVPFHYGFKSPPATSALGLDPLGIPLLKLHGSVNWAAQEGEFAIFRDYESVFKGALVPELVPPTWNKIVASRLGEVWQAAIEVLATATEIVVIGFSMPPTDLHFKYLLAAGMQKNISLRRIKFIAPDPLIRTRAEILFTQNEMKSGRVVFEDDKRVEDLFFDMHPNNIASIKAGDPRNVFL